MSVILVTGSGGSIGQELSLQIIENNPDDHVILNDISEYNLFQIQCRLERKGLKNFELLLGDCSDPFLQSMIEGKNVTQVYHAAAYKHVNLSKLMPQIYYRYNINSFISILKFCQSHDTKLTLISTDKAVEPINPMGFSKRLCEFIAVNAINNGDPVTIVRFGNVINSSGSVIPLFRAQIESGGPILLTDREATRYFMSISEAVDLVLQASKLRPNTYVLDMGKPVKIIDVAYQVASEYGKEIVDNPSSEDEIAMKIIGLREGEKLEEKLTYHKISESEKKGIYKAEEFRDFNTDLIQSIVNCIQNDLPLDINKIDWENGNWIK